MAETEEPSVDRLVDALRAAFPTVPEAQVRACVQDALDRFRDARIRSYIPVLATRRARAALACVARAGTTATQEGALR